MFGLTKKEEIILKKLSTPIKIQDWLDSVPLNLEKRGDTCMSPRQVLRENKMHCLEGALVAAMALWYQGEKPLLLDLRAPGDYDHVVALYRRHGYWGAISKTNHAALRFRDPIYKNLHELAASYFHEYFVNRTGRKVLRDCSSRPFDLRRFGMKWITTEEEMDYIAEALDDAPHQLILPVANRRLIRRADKMERRAGRLVEWKKSNPRT